MDYAKNLKYFAEANVKPGVIACLVGLVLLAVNALVGIVVIAVGAILIYLSVGGRPSDQDIDSAVNAQLGNLQQKALKKLGLDPEEVQEIAPISFHGYDYKGSGVKIKKGKDSKYRCSKYEAVVFLFAANDVHCYTYNFSITEDWHRESTDVYFYKDLVSVSTQTDSAKYAGNEFDFDCFRLTTSGGTSVSCNVWNEDDAQRSINAMRQLIFAKKRA